MTVNRIQLSMAKKWKIWEKTKGKCWFCGCRLNPFTPHPPTAPDSFTVDHVRPLKSKKDNRIANLVPCCLACNVYKADGSIHKLRMLIQALTCKNGHIFYFEKKGLLAGKDLTKRVK